MFKCSMNNITPSKGLSSAFTVGVSQNILKIDKNVEICDTDNTRKPYNTHV